MRQLQFYALGEWSGASSGRLLKDPTTQEPVAELPSAEVNFSDMLAFGRDSGKNIRALTFHQRAVILKNLAKYLLERKETYYEESFATGATRNDSWIDIEGGIGTLFTYSGKGRREMPNSDVYIDGDTEILSRDSSFVGQHICTPMQGVAIHINAYNFPCWGMLEKFAPTFLAGMPSIVKPASDTAFLTERVVRDIVASGLLPEGSLQLICGSTGDLLDQVNCEDVVTFTGSHSTGTMLKSNPAIVENSVRFNMEADSLNCAILGADATPDTPEFEAFIREVSREMTVKAGQKCTAIRRAIVPEDRTEAVLGALEKRLARIVPGNPRDEHTKMGPLAGLNRSQEVEQALNTLREDSEVVIKGGIDGAFCMPTVLLNTQPDKGCRAHEVEAFGPVCTIMPYASIDQAVDIARRGRGSLAGSIFTADNKIARQLALGTASLHGRLLLVNRDCAKTSTGHGSPLPVLLHGGPGRAGGGEELGGIRSVMHYMQRTALQGSPETLTAITGKWMPGANRTESEKHPFRKNFDELEIGDTLVSQNREVSLEDIEHFAEFTGDKFYAHMDEDAARANPFFDGRVAHGYFIVSAAAGLFVDPDPGPVLANYGLENLRFMQPVYPGDHISVSLTAKQKTAREGEDYGEVRWDAAVTNQNHELVAQYDVLTLVAR